MDGVDQISDKLHDLVNNLDQAEVQLQGLTKELDQLDALMPQMLNQFPPMIATMQSVRTMLLTMHSTMSGMFGPMDEMSQNTTAMGAAFDAAQNDDSFYLPPEIFQNADFQRAMNSFLSPDGKSGSILHFA